MPANATSSTPKHKSRIQPIAKLDSDGFDTSMIELRMSERLEDLDAEFNIRAAQNAKTPEARLDLLKAADRQLLISSKAFAGEKRLASWWHLGSTLATLFLFGYAAAVLPWLPLRLAASLITGLVLVRMFIIYHDFQHNAILQNSWIARRILHVYGHLMLTPPSVWKSTHDHHHKNNSKLFGASIGSFPIMTTTAYKNAKLSERLEYRITRNPSVIVLGYLTVFLFGMSIKPLIVDLRRHWDAIFALLLHFGTIAACWYFAGALTTFLVCILPTLIATASGAYLFYIQHNFPGAKIRRTEQWTYTGAALYSSSCLRLSPVMHWLTGNIGYHHVHHLNAKIPFYRLPEAMAGLPALQTPTTTSLSIRDIIGCLRLKLWDVSQDRFVTFAEAAANR